MALAQSDSEKKCYEKKWSHSPLTLELKENLLFNINKPMTQLF